MAILGKQNSFTASQLGERQIRNYQAEQPDANAWRLILLAAGR